MSHRRPEPPVTDLTDGVVVLRPRRADEGRRLFAVLHEGEEIGSVAVQRRADEVGRLTWELSPTATGRGFATKAVTLLVDYAFRGLHLARLEAYVDPANEKAMRVATRSGLRREGVVRGTAAAPTRARTGCSSPGWPPTRRSPSRRASGRC